VPPGDQLFPGRDHSALYFRISGRYSLIRQKMPGQMLPAQGHNGSPRLKSTRYRNYTMNIFFAVCWGASYLAMLVNFVLWGWRWSAEIGNDKATFFWGVMTAVFLVIGVAILRSIKDNLQE
jgi:hypothetical protein